MTFNYQTYYTYSATGVDEVDAQLTHRTNDGHQALYGVAVDDGAVLFALLVRIARLVNDLHLFDDCTLA